MVLKYLHIVSLLVFFPFLTISQSIPFEINVNHEPLSISQDQLHTATNISDLNRMFRPEWIREYHSVSISAIQENKIVQVQGSNGSLNEEQKQFLHNLNFPTTVSVSIYYTPENNLKDNPEREEIFSFSIQPTRAASYKAGEKKLLEYLKENATDHISNGVFQGYDLAIIKFTINEHGHVVDTSIFQSSKDEKTDELLHEVICNMPDWNPAMHSNGVKVRQEFVFTVGNHENCFINVLNLGALHE